jgi:hypothetical protein
MNQRRVHVVSGRIVLGLTLFAAALVMGATALVLLGQFNPAPGGDEGVPARLFQLAIVLLMPAGMVFLATADWRHPREIANRLIVPSVALVLAFSTLFYMERMR